MASRQQMQDHYEAVYDAAKSIGLNDVQAHLAASQSTHETLGGTSTLATQANNFFGIKGVSPKGRSMTVRSREYHDKMVDSAFAAYDSFMESLGHYAEKMARDYSKSWGAKTFEEAVAGLEHGRLGSYATDRDKHGNLVYGGKVTATHDRYGGTIAAKSAGFNSVRDMQEALVEAGFDISVDGIMGPETRSAMRGAGISPGSVGARSVRPSKANTKSASVQGSSGFRVTSKTRDQIPGSISGSKPGSRTISLDVNGFAGAFTPGAEAIIANDATAEERAAAEAYVDAVVGFFQGHGHKNYKNRGVRTAAENKRGLGNIIHAEPFFAQDPLAVSIATEHAAELAAITSKTLGKIEGAHFIAPHTTKDPGTIGIITERDWVLEHFMPEMAKLANMTTQIAKMDDEDINTLSPFSRDTMLAGAAANPFAPDTRTVMPGKGKIGSLSPSDSIAQVAGTGGPRRGAIGDLGRMAAMTPSLAGTGGPRRGAVGPNPSMGQVAGTGGFRGSVAPDMSMEQVAGTGGSRRGAVGPRSSVSDAYSEGLSTGRGVHSNFSSSGNFLGTDTYGPTPSMGQVAGTGGPRRGAVGPTPSAPSPSTTSPSSVGQVAGTGGPRRGSVSPTADASKSNAKGKKGVGLEGNSLLSTPETLPEPVAPGSRTSRSVVKSKDVVTPSQAPAPNDEYGRMPEDDAGPLGFGVLGAMRSRLGTARANVRDLGVRGALAQRMEAATRGIRSGVGLTGGPSLSGVLSAMSKAPNVDVMSPDRSTSYGYTSPMGSKGTYSVGLDGSRSITNQHGVTTVTTPDGRHAATYGGPLGRSSTGGWTPGQAAGRLAEAISESRASRSENGSRAGGRLGAVAEAMAANRAARQEARAARSKDKDSGADGDGGGTFLCTVFLDLGELDRSIWELDSLHGQRIARSDPDAYAGYAVWAEPLARHIRNDNASAKAIRWALRPFVLGWASHMAHIEKPSVYQRNPIGATLLKVGMPICRIIGGMRRKETAYG